MRDFEPFYRFHKLTVRYEDGTVLVDANAETGASTKAKSYAIIGPVGDARLFFMSVGNSIDDHRKEWISKDETYKLLSHGVPDDYVAPHDGP